MNPVTEEFYNQFDTQFAVGEMAFSDGIYNILSKELRAFKPQDYVTRVLDYEAPNRPAPLRAKSDVKQMLQKLFPDEGQRNTIMMHYAYTGFTVDNVEKTVVQIQGDGNNGKSTLMQITNIVFGAYSQVMVDKMLDVRTNAGEIMMWPITFHGKRWLWQDESTAKKAMDGCKVKRYSGGTGLCTRVPYGPLINVIPTRKMLFMGNDMADFQPMDQALSDRFINVQMVSTFTNDEEKRARALAGPYKKYVYNTDPDCSPSSIPPITSSRGLRYVRTTCRCVSRRNRCKAAATCRASRAISCPWTCTWARRLRPRRYSSACWTSQAFTTRRTR
jgi:phage/plasmid-associated DNA primase